MPLLIALAVFVGAPLVELYVLIEVGGEIGALPTIALSVFTAVLGGLLVRMQGLSVVLRVQQALGREELPAIELLEGAVLLATGVLLLLPGFITDALGFLMLVPALRRALIVAWLRRRGNLRPGGRGPGPDAGSQGYIEGEFRRDD
jgi:UPF0716 protein FxsA